LGHEVLTIVETGQAGQAIPDEQVLAFAIAEGRAVLPLIRFYRKAFSAKDVMTHVKVVIEKHPDGYVADPLGLTGFISRRLAAT
jgi:hypothetical protein